METVRAWEPTQIWFESRFLPFMYYLNLGIFYKSMGFSFLTNENFIKKVVTRIIIIWWSLVYSSCLWQAGNKQKHEAAHGATCMAAGKKQAEVEGHHTPALQSSARLPLAGWPRAQFISALFLSVINGYVLLPCRAGLRIRGTVWEALSAGPATQ